MDIATLLTRFWHLRYAVLAAAVVSVIAAAAIAYHVTVWPPSIKDAKLRIATAQTQILLDSPRSTIGDLSSPVEPLASRAEIYTQFLQTEEVRARIAKVTGLPAGSFAVEGQTDGVSPVTGQDQRAAELLTESPGARVFFRSENGSPIISIFTQAPTMTTAVGLANGAAKAIGSYVTHLQKRQQIPGVSRLQIDRLGRAHGGVINGGVGRVQVALTAAGFFIVLCVALLIWSNVLLDIRRARRRGDRLDAEWAAAKMAAGRS
jgi:hypothetical protein